MLRGGIRREDDGIGAFLGEGRGAARRADDEACGAASESTSGSIAAATPSLRAPPSPAPNTKVGRCGGEGASAPAPKTKGGGDDSTAGRSPPVASPAGSPASGEQNTSSSSSSSAPFGPPAPGAPCACSAATCLPNTNPKSGSCACAADDATSPSPSGSPLAVPASPIPTCMRSSSATSSASSSESELTLDALFSASNRPVRYGENGVGAKGVRASAQLVLEPHEAAVSPRAHASKHKRNKTRRRRRFHERARQPWHATGPPARNAPRLRPDIPQCVTHGRV